jgi:hypothetical protein
MRLYIAGTFTGLRLMMPLPHHAVAGMALLLDRKRGRRPSELLLGRELVGAELRSYSGDVR